MIKGINRQIIEVNDTGSRYFERALLFIRPDSSVPGEKKLKTEARKMIARWETPTMERVYPKAKKKRKIKSAIFALVWSVVGAGTYFALQTLVF